jgi:Xaa-Pro aminopeptidase
MGIDYKCGTGQGVGYILNVHEGPQGIRWRYAEGVAEAILEEGMTVTDEPGVYIAGKHGIRLENELLCVEKAESEYGRFLGFDCLTLCPIDLDAVDPAYLDERELDMLNAYHARVYDLLAPELTEEERSWLRKYTAPLQK